MKFDICPRDGEMEWMQRHLSSGSDLSSASLALYCWEGTYGFTGERPARGTPDEWAHTYGEVMMRQLGEATEQRTNPSMHMQLAFLAKWAHQAYTTVAVGERYAAALMASHVSGDALQGARSPWDAFVIAVPGGLLNQYDRVRFGVFDIRQTQRDGSASARARLGVYSTVTRELLVQNSATIEDCLSEPESEQNLGLFPVAGEDERVLRLAQRLVAGCILAALRRDDVIERMHGGGKRKRQTVSPSHRVVTIGRALSLDVRPAVRDYVAGRSSSMLTVQSLVRGHYKRQAHGLQMAERKTIWIEPYWRGPDEAPILGKTFVLPDT